MLTMEEELSLAYLHAVCARAKISCVKAERALDNDGIDATLKARFPEATFPQLEDCHLEVQMKATRKPAEIEGSCYSYWVQGHKRYESLRNDRRQLARIIVVLYLPEDENEWLLHSDEQLILRRCAYWASLSGAPSVTTTSGARIAIPMTQRLSPVALEQLMFDISLGIEPKFSVSGEN